MSKEKAQEFHIEKMKLRYFRAILEYSKMENKKLESISKVKAYLEQKAKTQILTMLKININQSKSS